MCGLRKSTVYKIGEGGDHKTLTGCAVGDRFRLVSMAGVDGSRDETVEGTNLHSLPLLASLKQVVDGAAELEAVVIEADPIIVEGDDGAGRDLEAVVGGLGTVVDEDTVDGWCDLVGWHAVHDRSQAFEPSGDGARLAKKLAVALLDWCRGDLLLGKIGDASGQLSEGGHLLSAGLKDSGSVSHSRSSRNEYCVS